MPKAKPETKSEKAKAAKPTLSVPVYSLAGEQAGSLDLPKEVFGAKVNESLMIQALRVYLANQKAHFGNTQTRAEVKGTTAKVWRQKGTGRARHGAKTAPIFVGGGIALGPKFRKVVLDLPKKMKRAALLSALAQKIVEGEVVGVAGAEQASGKTAQLAKLMQKLGKKNVLIATGGKVGLLNRAVRNLPGVDALPADQLNTFEVIKHQTLMVTREAAEKLAQGKKGEQA